MWLCDGADQRHANLSRRDTAANKDEKTMNNTPFSPHHFPDRSTPDQQTASQTSRTRNRCSLFAWAGAALAACCVAWPAAAQEPRKIVLSDNQFKESYLEKVTVSGGIRAGFMRQSALEHIDLNELYIQLQHDVNEQDAMLCVNMVSRDGRYAASWQYPLGVQPAGSMLVDLPSKYRAQISGYAPDALAVLAGVAHKDCLAGEMRYVPASWGVGSASEYVLYVNSGNTETEIGVPGAAGRIPCAKIAADSAIAYDTQCLVPKNLIAEPKSIFILRNNFGNRLPHVEFPVR